MLIAVNCILFGMLHLYLLGFGSRYLLVLKTLQVSKTLAYDRDVIAINFGRWNGARYEYVFCLYFQYIFMFVNIPVYYVLRCALPAFVLVCKYLMS